MHLFQRALGFILYAVAFVMVVSIVRKYIALMDTETMILRASVAMVTVIMLCYNTVRRWMRVLAMLEKDPQYVIALDLEFTGILPLHNQIVSIGAALMEVRTGKILSTFSSGLLGLEPSRVWHPKCLPWWQNDAGEEMRAMIPKINNHNANYAAWLNDPTTSPKPETTDFRNGIHRFIMWVDSEVERIRRINPNADVRFLTDTVSNDCSQLNAALDFVGHNLGLTHWFGKYRDVLHLDNYLYTCTALCYTREVLKDHPYYPINAKKHDAEHDAIFIAMQYHFYRSVLSNYPFYFAFWQVLPSKPPTTAQYAMSTTPHTPIGDASSSKKPVPDKKTD